MTAASSRPRSGAARRRLRSAVLAALTAVLVVGPTTVVHADPAGPSHYRSQVTDLQPATDAVTVEIVGGDTFLRIVVEPGHTATVHGYRGEPYLRVDTDGTVQANHNSPAYYLNQDRYADIPVPDRADPDAEPDWTPVATDGTHAWHDHRIHWMSRDLPRSVRSGEGVQTVTEVSPWEVPIAVDDADITVRGELVWMPSTNPLLPLMVGLLAAALGWTAVGRDTSAALALLAAAAAATGVAAGEAAIQPGGIAAGWTTWALPALATLPAAGAAVLDTPRHIRNLLIVSGTLTTIWLLQHLPTLWLPVLPSLLDDTAARALTAATAGLLVGAVAGHARTAVGPVSSEQNRDSDPTAEG